MKTIVETETKLSKYLLADDTVITATSETITVGDPPQFIIADLNSGNTTIVENVTNAPSDWAGNKYTLDGTVWAANPNWSLPDEEEG